MQWVDIKPGRDWFILRDERQAGMTMEELRDNKGRREEGKRWK